MWGKLDREMKEQTTTEHMRIRYIYENSNDAHKQ